MVGEDVAAAPQGRHDRVVTLDALRGLAAWLVLLSHVGFWTGRTADGAIGGLAARGDAGVAIFFALSAFLLSGPLVRRALGREVRWSPSTYARRRAARILPPYYLALGAVVATALLLGGPAAAVLDAPTLLVHLGVGQGVTGRTFQSFTQTWSLTSEVTFYVLLPVLAGALTPWVTAPASPRARAHRMLAVWTLVGTLGVLVQAGVSPFTGPGASWWPGAVATSALGHALWFAVGGALAVVLEAESSGVRLVGGRGATLLEMLRTSPGTMLLAAGVLWLAAATSLAGPRDLADPSTGAAVAKEVVYALAAGGLMLAALSRGVAGVVADSRLAGACRFLGNTSYGVFLWHVLVLQVVFAVLDLPLFAAPFVPVLVLVTVLSLGLAQLSWVLVERPVIAWAHGRPVAAEPRPAHRA